VLAGCAAFARSLFLALAYRIFCVLRFMSHDYGYSSRDQLQVIDQGLPFY
jgi:hypothetical protein